jgi:hypothetical protein
MHAQALTLAMLSSAAALHYYTDMKHADTNIGGDSNSCTVSASSLSFQEEERLSWWF